MSNLAETLLEEFNEEERKEIKCWAENAFVIRNDSNLSSKLKIQKLYEISWRSSIITKFLKAAFRVIKKNGWVERSLTAKMAISGAVLGLATVGSNFVGIASAGIGLSMPFFVLTSAGGALLGTIIEEVNKSQKK